ncbi:hypothetical protein [Streptomyces sp. NBC_00273]|uniref:hypothetical protein n=1 Tax=Streptomyces sp. NBC_00273 TaxID=2903644 RepID=UPI002E2E584C|nr:hypothetical protein [Streptomyces sp. NBC_00273]
MSTASSETVGRRRVAVVTGGAGAKGGAIAARLAVDHTVVILDRTGDIPVDLGDPADARRAAQLVLERYGRCDVVPAEEFEEVTARQAPPRPAHSDDTPAVVAMLVGEAAARQELAQQADPRSPPGPYGDAGAATSPPSPTTSRSTSPTDLPRALR